MIRLLVGVILCVFSTYAQDGCISYGGMCFTAFCPPGYSQSYKVSCGFGTCCFRTFDRGFIPCLVFGGKCRAQCLAGSHVIGKPAGCEEGHCCSFPRSDAASGTKPVEPNLPPWRFTTERPTTTEPRCGANAMARILYGPEIKPCAWPWLAAIRVGPQEPHSQRFACAGVLVDDDTVITVAHCLDGISTNRERVEIIIGESDQSEATDFAREVRVREIRRHPHYNQRLREGDLAILKLERKLPVSDCSVPACLAEKDSEFVEGGLCTIAGWGKSNLLPVLKDANLLRSARVAMMKQPECAAVMKYMRYTQPKNTLCVDIFKSQSLPCWGDEGGMLACLNSRGEYVVRGLIQTQSCEFPDSPNLLVNVANYTEWIRGQF